MSALSDLYALEVRIARLRGALHVLDGLARREGAVLARPEPTTERAGFRGDGAVAGADPSGEAGRLAAECDELAEVVRGALDTRDETCHDLRPSRLADIDEADLLDLLEVLVEDESSLPRRWALAEALVTFLATDRRDGHVTRDPVTLSPRLQTLIEAQPAGPEARAIERRLVEAAPEIDAMPLAEALARADRGALGAGPGLPTPALLRALVFYRARLWSRIETSRNRAVDARGESSPVDGVVPASPAAPRWGLAEPTAPTARPATSRSSQRADRPPTPAPPATSLHAGAGWQIAEPPPKPIQESRPRSRWRSLRRLPRVVATAALVAAAAWVWLAPPRGTVHVLSQSELRAISPWLADGYRNRSGHGPLFIGSLSTSWDGLDSPEQSSSTRRIVQHLDHSGVQDVMLYDGQRRLVVQSGVKNDREGAD